MGPEKPVHTCTPVERCPERPPGTPSSDSSPLPPAATEAAPTVPGEATTTALFPSVVLPILAVASPFPRNAPSRGATASTTARSSATAPVRSEVVVPFGVAPWEIGFGCSRVVGSLTPLLPAFFDSDNEDGQFGFSRVASGGGSQVHSRRSSWKKNSGVFIIHSRSLWNSHSSCAFIGLLLIERMVPSVQ